jgi:hypothetical protein
VRFIDFSCLANTVRLASKIGAKAATRPAHVARMRLPPGHRDGAGSGIADERVSAAASRELEHATQAAEDPRAPRAAGLAVFASPERCFTLQSAAGFVPLVTIGPRFYLVPLLPGFGRISPSSLGWRSYCCAA